MHFAFNLAREKRDPLYGVLRKLRSNTILNCRTGVDHAYRVLDPDTISSERRIAYLQSSSSSIKN